MTQNKSACMCQKLCKISHPFKDMSNITDAWLSDFDHHPSVLYEDRNACSKSVIV